MLRRRLVAAAALLAPAIAGFASGGSAGAQEPAYAATPPTPGALYHDGQSGRYLLGGSWLYRADRGNVGIAQGFWRDSARTEGWSPVTVPNAYNAGDLSGESMNGYVGWYRRDFTLPRGAFTASVPARARHWIIRFESVNYRASVWLNGRPIGSHTGAFLPFELDLKPRAGVNRLVVRVDNRRSGTDLPPGPSGLWWNYGGITREVYLRAAARADIARVRIRPLLRCLRCAAKIEEQAIIRNVTGSPERVRLRGSYGPASLNFGQATIAPHSSWTASARARLRHPKLWSIDSPHLYRAALVLRDGGGRRLGSYAADSGVRSIKVVGGRLALNGRLLSLRGVSMHEADLAHGSALGPPQLAQLVGWVRSLGATLIRSHYPLNPQIQEMADRDGILVWSEVPVYQVPSAQLADPGLLRHARAILSDNIATNQNHPSVLLWSIGNELPAHSTPPEDRYVAHAVALAHHLDPTRPVALDISDWKGVGCQAGYAPLDVIGVNEYYGYFDAGAGATDDRDGLSPFLDEFRSCYPRKALFVTEFGFDGNRHGPMEERGTYEFQSNSVAFHLGVFASKPWLSGAIYWLIQDFASKPGWDGGNPLGTPPFVQKGLFDLHGDPKPAFALVSSIYHHAVQIAGRRR